FWCIRRWTPGWPTKPLPALILSVHTYQQTSDGSGGGGSHRFLARAAHGNGRVDAEAVRTLAARRAWRAVGAEANRDDAGNHGPQHRRSAERSVCRWFDFLGSIRALDDFR